MKRVFAVAGVMAFLLSQAGMAATYYVATNGNDANSGSIDHPWKTVQKAANTLNAGDTVYVMNGTYHEVVSVTRSGTSSDPMTFRNYPGQAPVIDGAGQGAPSGVLVIQNCAHIRVDGLGIMNTDSVHQSGIWLWNADDVKVERCYVYNTYSSGIKVNWSSNIVVNENEIEKCCQSGSEENISIKLVSHDVVASRNYIHNTAKEGIDVKEGAYNVLVIGNYLHNVERQALYADAWDRPTYNIEYRDNIMHDCDFGMGACAEMGGLLSNVRFVNNLAYDCNGPGMFCKDWGGATPHPMQDIYYVNNTVYNCAWGWGAGMDIGTYEANNVVVRNNILSQCGIPVRVNREPISKIIEKNLCENTTGIDPNWCIQGMPRFVNAAGDDFHLRGDSNAIDTGTSADAPAVDIEGKARPMGGRFDIGAYERAMGDLDWDGNIDFADFAILGGQWQQGPGTPSGDISPYPGDGVVDWVDVTELARCWGR